MKRRIVLEVDPEVFQNLKTKCEQIGSSLKDVLVAGIPQGIEIIKKQKEEKMKPLSLEVEVFENNQWGTIKSVADVHKKEIYRCRHCHGEVRLHQGVKLQHHMEHKHLEDALKCPVSPLSKIKSV